MKQQLAEKITSPHEAYIQKRLGGTERKQTENGPDITSRVPVDFLWAQCGRNVTKDLKNVWVIGLVLSYISRHYETCIPGPARPPWVRSTDNLQVAHSL